MPGNMILTSNVNFAPIVRMSTIWIQLGRSMVFNLYLKKLDVKKNLDEEIYIT